MRFYSGTWKGELIRSVLHIKSPMVSLQKQTQNKYKEKKTQLWFKGINLAKHAGLRNKLHLNLKSIFFWNLCQCTKNFLSVKPITARNTSTVCQSVDTEGSDSENTPNATTVQFRWGNLEWVSSVYLECSPPFLGLLEKVKSFRIQWL